MDHGTQSLRDLLSGIASESIAPAGGTAAAVAGAIAASACEMACIHTIGNPEYDDVKADVTEIRNGLGRHRDLLLELADKDAEVVDDVFASSADAVGQAEIKRSIGVPLSIAEACLTVIEGGVEVFENGAPSTEADAITGVLLAHAALRASVFTARSNMERVTDRSFIERLQRRIATIEDSAERLLTEPSTGIDQW